MPIKLQTYFPLIRTREEIMGRIQDSPVLLATFQSWKPKHQDEFLDFCSGVRGVKLLYDSFFKSIMDPEQDPERLSDLLSLLMGRKIRVLRELPHEGGRVTPDTLVVMDIIVQLEDGSITTVEVQKYGYAFPGQRAACYSADMLLRQYKKLRDDLKRQNKRMNYRAVKPVYTIVLYESSPPVFEKHPDTYVHHFRQVSDTGLEMDLLEEYFFVPLDIFRHIIQNKGIRDRRDAWLAFLTLDDPEWIEKVINAYPDFRALYEEAYEMCLNLEKVMGMYSKVLKELDSNTVQYMIDEMQETINRKDEQLSQKDEQLSQKDEQLSQKDEQLSQKDEQLSQKDEQLSQKNEQLSQKNEQLNQKDEQLNQKDALIDELRRQINELQAAQGK